MLFNAILLSVWVIPVLSLLLFFALKRDPRFYKKWAIACTGVFLLLCLLPQFGITFRSSRANYYSIPVIYFTGINLMFYLIFRSKIILRVLLGLLLGITVLLGWFFGSIGIFSLQDMTSNYDYEQQLDLGNGYTYRERAVRKSRNYKPLRIDVDKSLALIPFLQHNKLQVEFTDYSRQQGDIQVRFDAENKLLYLFAPATHASGKDWKKECPLK